MPALWYAGPRLWAVRQPVTLDNNDPVGVPGQDVGREKPREAPAHDDGVPTAPAAACAPTALLSGRVHRTTPLVATS